MKYEEFRDSIAGLLRARPKGATWVELKERLRLPQRTACPTWIRRKEGEVGLQRIRGPTGMVWRVPSRKGARDD